jgi:predicted NACHT family NTPase
LLIGLIAELNTKYQVPKAIAKPWVTQQQLLLLLDGLDEVRAEYRDACVVALNQFQQTCGTEIVVCSRIKNYEALSQRLTVQRAIYLRSLQSTQIDQYLSNLNADLTGLRQLLLNDPALQELARSPLVLNILVLAYEGIALEGFSSN